MPVTAPAAIDHSITLNDLRLNYREWPNEGAQPLVLLHGFTGHARSWDSFAEAMQPGYRVLALDQRGHGESEWASDYAPERNVDDLNAFVRALGLQQFALLGLSMGGRNVMTYAPLHPEEVERLVIVDIGPEVATAGSARIRAGVLARDIFDDPEEAVASMRAGNARAPESELRHRCLNNLKQTSDGKWTWKYDAVLRSPNRPLPNPDSSRAWELLRKIACPTLLVRGAESDILSPEVAARMVSEIPDCRMVTVQESGHSVPLDNPSGFHESMKGFLRT